LPSRCRFGDNQRLARRREFGRGPEKEAKGHSDKYERLWKGGKRCSSVFYYSRDRAGEHPQAHLANYTGIFQADAYSGYGKFYELGLTPGPILEAACWVHARRPFFVMADLAENVHMLTSKVFT
jgi:Transposase IS66 family